MSSLYQWFISAIYAYLRPTRAINLVPLPLSKELPSFPHFEVFPHFSINTDPFWALFLAPRSAFVCACLGRLSAHIGALQNHSFGLHPLFLLSSGLSYLYPILGHPLKASIITTIHPWPGIPISTPGRPSSLNFRSFGSLHQRF